MLLSWRGSLVQYGLIITRDYHASEDIYQNLVLKVMNVHLEFDNELKLMVWSRKVVYSESCDWLRKQGRELTWEDNRIYELLNSENAVDQSNAIRYSNWSEILEDCLSRLNEESKRLLNLRYDKSRRCGEVAELLGLSIESVYKRLSRIHMMLRDCFKTKTGKTPQGGIDHVS